MLKSREELNELLTQVAQKKSFEPYVDTIADYVFECHGIPKGELNDYFSGRKDWSEANDVIAFCVIESFKKVKDC